MFFYTIISFVFLKTRRFYHRLRLRTRAAAKRKIPQVSNVPNHDSLQHFLCHLSPQLILLQQMQSDHECLYHSYKIYCYYFSMSLGAYLCSVTAYNTWFFSTMKYCIINTMYCIIIIVLSLLYYYNCIIVLRNFIIQYICILFIRRVSSKQQRLPTV